MSGRFIQSLARPVPLLGLAACIAAFTVSVDANAQATVAVTRLADMTFGDVSSGSATSLDYSDAGASVFRLDASGLSGFQVIAITFTLPTEIVNGGDSIPITFGGADAAWSYANDPAIAISFDPHASADVPKDGNVFSVYVWVGATIDPDQSTPAQQYSNTFTLDADIQ